MALEKLIYPKCAKISKFGQKLGFTDNIHIRTYIHIYLRIYDDTFF